MEPDRFAALVAALAEDRLDEDGARELLELIAAEPARRGELRRSLSVEALLRPRRAPALPEQVMSSLPSQTRRIRIAEGVMQRLPPVPARPWWRRTAFLLAASLLLALGATTWLALGSSGSEVAEVIGGGGLAAGSRVRDGDRLELAAGARLRLDELADGHPDGTRLMVTGPARLRMANEDAARVIILDSGTLDASVAPRTPGHPLLVRTPQALATIVGTRFVIAVDAAGTRLDVEEGTVVLAQGEASLQVGANQAAIADAVGLRSDAAWIRLIPDPAQPLRVMPGQPVPDSAWRVTEDAEGRLLVQDSLGAMASGNLRLVPATRSGVIEGELQVTGAAAQARAGWALRPAGAGFAPGTMVGDGFTAGELGEGRIAFRVEFRLGDGGNLRTSIAVWPFGGQPPAEPRIVQALHPDVPAIDGLSLWCDRTAIEFRNLRYRPLEP